MQLGNVVYIHVIDTIEGTQSNAATKPCSRSIVLLLFLQKQNLANAIYLFGFGTLLSGLGLKHMRLRSHHDLACALVIPLLLGRPWWSTTSPTCLPLSMQLLQMTTTDVAFPPYCRSCPCDRHDLYLPSIPASLQTLGRCECVSACALAPLGLRIISPLTFYLSFLRSIWTFDKNLAPIFPSHLSTVTPQIFSDPRPHSQHMYMSIYIYIYIYTHTHTHTHAYIYL